MTDGEMGKEPSAGVSIGDLALAKVKVDGTSERTGSSDDANEELQRARHLVQGAERLSRP